MEVSLISFTKNPKQVIYSAAKQCYSKANAKDIYAKSEKITSKKLKDFITYLSNLGHLSPLEHVSFTFAINGISRTCTHQLVRHRLASYSQQSQRYVDMDNFEYIIPPSIRKRKNIEKRFIEIMEYIKKSYVEIRSELKEDKSLDREAINQDLRFILPQAVETKIVVTMNIRELLHFFQERLCSRAQWEIRQVAFAMLKLCKKILPEVFNLAGAKCKKFKFCPEGDKGCGLYPAK